jgi:hypothetical protein
MSRECKYFNLPSGCKKGQNCKYLHLPLLNPYKHYFHRRRLIPPEYDDWSCIEEFESSDKIDDMYCKSARFKIREHLNNARECRMGPVWRHTYYMLMEYLHFIPESIIREILYYHIAPFTDGNKCDVWAIDQGIKSPRCMNCSIQLNYKSKFYAAIGSPYEDEIIRIICKKCMPMKLLKEGIGNEEPKVGPGLYPQNNAALAAFLCMNNPYWTIFDSYTWSNYLYISNKKNVPVLHIDMLLVHHHRCLSI